MWKWPLPNLRDTIPTFAWRVQGKPWNISVRINGPVMDISSVWGNYQSKREGAYSVKGRGPQAGARKHSDSLLKILIFTRHAGAKVRIGI
jgi:hypothetical protein